MRKVLAALLLVPVLAFSACTAGKSDQEKQVADKAKNFKAYLPQNTVELDNYNNAQKLYDSPDTIIWCTATWANPSSPLVTVPVAGKLTSSSTTFFAPLRRDGDSDGNVALPNRSIDGLYHPDPPKYRYGFTPGGQYVDFYELPTFCTTAVTKFQREQTELAVTVDSEAAAADKLAEAALARGDKKGAQKALESLEGGK